MKKDKLSWAGLVREAEEKKMPLVDFLLQRSAAQLEITPEAIMEKMEHYISGMPRVDDVSVIILKRV